MKRILSVAAVIAAITPSLSLADNWGNWRGPTGNGVSTTANPPTTWSATENVKWKVAVPGKSAGSPVVWEDRVFVTTAVDVKASSEPAPAETPQPNQRRGRRGFGGGFGRGPSLNPHSFEVHCYNRATGELLWKQVATEATPHEGTHSTNTFASASPCTDGELVYAQFGSRGLYCYTMDGEPVWQRTDFGKMQMRNGFGEGSSPTIAGDMLIVPWDHEGPSFLFALNKRTGETIWKTERDEPSCWASPLIVENNGKKQIVMNGQNAARAYDLETGKELWQCGGQTDRPGASAVANEEYVYVGSGFRGSFLGAFKMTGNGDIEGTSNVVWTIERDTPDIPSPLLSGNRLYFFKGKSGILTCVNADTGEPFYSAERIRGLDQVYASPIAAGGFVYLCDRDGDAVVIKDSPTLEVVASNSIGEAIDGTPAPVDSQLFIRGANHLFCIEAK